MLSWHLVCHLAPCSNNTNAINPACAAIGTVLLVAHLCQQQHRGRADLGVHTYTTACRVGSIKGPCDGHASPPKYRIPAVLIPVPLQGQPESQSRLCRACRAQLCFFNTNACSTLGALLPSLWAKGDPASCSSVNIQTCVCAHPTTAVCCDTKLYPCHAGESTSH